MAEVLFWSSFLFVAYAYFGYPALLFFWKKTAPRPIAKAPCEPEVTVVMAACNEKQNITQKIRNCLSLNYPRELMQIIVSLDGPTDGTEILALSLAGRGVEMVYTPKHMGKAAAINNAVARARGEILVFVDTRQTLDPDVVRELTANFSDHHVGAVSGELMLLDESGRESSSGVGLYWRYEKFIRTSESAIHSTVGATGAIYAVRRQLFKELPEASILDDVIVPMHIVLSGSRVAFDPGARAYEKVSEQQGREFSRKVRTLTGNFQLLTLMPELLNPRRNPVFLQFISHKVARLFVPYALIVLFISNLFLLRDAYLLFLAGQVLWYSMAAGGYLLTTGSESLTNPEKPKLEGRT